MLPSSVLFYPFPSCILYFVVRPISFVVTEQCILILHFTGCAHLFLLQLFVEYLLRRRLVGTGGTVMDMTHVVCALGGLKVLCSPVTWNFSSVFCKSSLSCWTDLQPHVGHSTRFFSERRQHWSQCDLVISASRGCPFSPGPLCAWQIPGQPGYRATQGLGSTGACSRNCEMDGQKEPKRVSPLRLSFCRGSHGEGPMTLNNRNWLCESPTHFFQQHNNRPYINLILLLLPCFSLYSSLPVF